MQWWPVALPALDFKTMSFSRVALLLLLVGLAFGSQPRLLSPLLRDGGDVRAASKVGPLPGISATSYSGFFQTDPVAHTQLFFWYWPALNGNTSAPVIVWLQGGPGSSSLFGLFVEHGPYSLDANLFPHANPYTWATNYSVVYLDNPRGTGYSFTDANTLCADWECYANDFDAWLRQFVSAYGLQENQVFISGESYAGHYVPASAYRVMQNNIKGVQPLVNLAGIAVGNGFVAPPEMSSGYADEIYNAGLISWEDYGVAQSYVANITAAINNKDFVGAYLIWDAFLNGDATPGGAWFNNVTGGVNYYNIATEMAPSLNYYSSYVVSDAVRQAIGVGLLPYVDGNPLVEQALRGDVMFTQKPRLEALLQSGLNVLIYNGALDLICGAPLTERYLRVLRWSGSRDFLAARRQLWHDPVYPGGAISGFWRKARNLQQIVMRGAGHLAPFDQPARSLDLITRFVDGKDFD